MSQRGSLFGFLAVVMVPAAAGAQDSVQSFGSLSDRLKAGNTIVVTQGSDEVSGKVVEVTPTALVISVGGTLTTFNETAVTRVQRHRSYPGKGALFGLLAGAAATALCTALSACDGSDAGSGIPGWVGPLVALGGLGAGAGAIVGQSMTGRETVFEAAGMAKSARVTMAPLLGPTHKGVAFSLAF